MYSKNLIKGTLQPLILKLLEDNTRMYGYEMSQRVKEITKGKIELTEGALYPSLHKLEAEGIVKTEKEYIGKRVRKYYSLTTEGRLEVKLRVTELADFIAAISILLLPKKLPHGTTR